MWKYIVGSLAAVAVLGGGYVFFAGWMEGTGTRNPPAAQQPQQIATTTYATTTFSLIYPINLTKDDSYVYEQFAPKLIHGVKFSISEAMATGTNLSIDSGISIEQLPRAIKCTGDIFIKADVKAQELTDSGVVYSVATTSEAAAGNFYEEHVFALSGTKPCTAVRYFTHSMNIGHYPAGTVRGFDRTALMTAFDEIRRSLVFRAQ